MILRANFIVFTLSFLALVGCSRPSPEAALRENVAQMADAVRARDTSAVLKHIADDFVRDSGGVDKAEVRRILTGVFLRNEKIALTTTVREVKIDGAIGTAKINVVATGGAGLIPERADGWEFTTAWRRSGNDWKLYNAQWQ